MNVSYPPMKGLALIDLTVYRDSRGFFVERFQIEQYREHGLPTKYVQDNHSRSAPGVLRGLHYQWRPEQGKLVGVIRGRIWDVTVDLRSKSSTFGQHFATELSDENGRLLWVPSGFAHGFCVLGDEPADVLYKVDASYNAAGEAGLHWADPELAIAWPVRKPRNSVRDESLSSFAEYRQQPIAWEAEGLAGKSPMA